MLYFAYPALVVLIFAILLGWLYRLPGRINEVFIAYRRPVALRRAIGLWFGVMAAVFVFAQWLRFPFLVYLVNRLAHPTQFASVFDFAHTLGLLVVLLAEITVVCQWIIYIIQCWRGIVRYHLPETLPLRHPAPSVVMLIPSCDEDPDTLRRSLASAARLTYPNVSVYLVENSRTTTGKAEAVRLAEECGIAVIHVVNRGNKGRALNDAMKCINPVPVYLSVMDADQDMQADFLERVVPLAEKDARLAFVQTAQLYENAEHTLTSRAAAQQETLHYDTIQEGKGAVGLPICCGTNFVMRWQALAEVGGWDETSVSEDMATSFEMHRRGWRSLYVRRHYAIGLGPLTLSSYWKQQRRWAIGGTTVLLQVLRTIFKTRAPVPGRVAVEYIWSSAYYAMTIALAVLATLPVLLLLAVRLKTPGGLIEQPAMRPLEWVYFSVYPLYAAVMLFPYVHMRLRGYPLRNLVMMQGILAITIPVYFLSVVKALWQKVSFFEVSPKREREERIAVWSAPQTYLFFALLFAGAVFTQLVLTHRVAPAAWIVVFWCLFYTLSFGHFLVFALLNRMHSRTAEPAPPKSPSRDAAASHPVVVSHHVQEAETQD